LPKRRGDFLSEAENRADDADDDAQNQQIDANRRRRLEALADATRLDDDKCQENSPLRPVYLGAVEKGK
jgi:hypothetical protein